MSINKEKYRELCASEPTIPIFSRAWWLDATAGDSWDVVLFESNGIIHASLPFVIKKKFSLIILSQPPLTQHLGPWLRSKDMGYTERLAWEKYVLQELYKKLPKHDIYQQNWYFKNTNWLPLYWLGFQQTTRYTYRIDDISDHQKVWSNFQKKYRADIKKALTRFDLTVRTDLSLDDFIVLNNKVFSRQGLVTPYSPDFVRKLDAAALKNNARKIFFAVDGEGRHHAALYLIWDDHAAYLLMEGSDPSLRKSGAISLLRWEAIKYASTVTKSFDFEGSMIEGVEHSYRSFGTVQTPYFSISKINSKFVRAALCLREMITT